MESNTSKNLSVRIADAFFALSAAYFAALLALKISN